MAKIIQQEVIIKFSKIGRSDDESVTFISEETIATLEQVAQELAESGVIVEVTSTNES